MAETAEHLDARRVKGADPDVVCAVIHKLRDTVLHLFCGLIGKCDRKDVVGAYIVFLNQIRDAVRDDSCLAGTCSRKDQKRAETVHDGFALFGV